MTAKEIHNVTLEEVLNEIATAASPPDAQALRIWTARYPQFAHEIVHFATDWIEFESADGDNPLTCEDEEVDRVVNRTMSRVQQLLDAADRPSTMTDLAAAIRLGTAAFPDCRSELSCAADNRLFLRI